MRVGGLVYSALVIVFDGMGRSRWSIGAFSV